VWWLPHVFSILGFFLGLILLSRILRERRPPASTLAWLLVIVLVPYLGVPLYFLIGGRKHRRLAARKDRLYTVPTAHEEPSLNAIERILLAGGAPRTSMGGRIQLCSTGEETFMRLTSLFQNARSTIDISTFILGGDETGHAFAEILAERARQGVQVRLLLDGLFAFRPKRKQLACYTRAGGRLAVFMPLLRLPFRGPANLRNHRKIIVVDGETAVVGGMNLASEYMGKGHRNERWRDLSLIIEGPAVSHIHNVFRSDWAFASGDAAAPETYPLLKQVGDANLQIVASGPDVPGDTYYDAILTALFQARERVWIATPYFIPDEAIARGMVLAARRGLDVRLLVPLRSNHLTADIAGGSYLRQIAKAGARIYAYGKGMMHAKVTLIDRDLAIFGSANLDMRSLFLDYEIAAFLYTPHEVAEFDAWFQALMAECEAGIPEPGSLRALAEDVGRLLAPLM